MFVLSLLAISLAINLAFFIVAYLSQSDHFTDITYALSFIALALFALLHRHSAPRYNIVLSLMVMTWAVRIGSFLLFRVFKNGRDKRFDGRRNKIGKSLQFWLGQAISVWLIMLPAMLALKNNRLNHRLVAGAFVVWVIGLVIETVADFEKYKFKKNPKNKSKWIDSGMWHYSRHPNYFGEILVWFGIYFFTFPVLSNQDRLIGLIGPFYIAFILIFVTGVPPLEKSADKKWGKEKGYMKYKRETSLLIPFAKFK